MTEQNPYERPAPPIPSETPPAVGSALPATAFGRFTFGALIPSLLLPVAMVFLAFMGSANRTAMYDFTGIFAAVFGFILLGSMTLNAWLLLRHPESWRLRALPNGLALQLVILWALIIALGVVVYFTSLDLGSITLGCALIVLSLIVFVFALIRQRVRTAVAPVIAVGPEPFWRVLGIAYLVLVVLSIALGVLSLYSGGPILSAILLVPVGLPWTWPLGVIAAVTLAYPPAGIVCGILTLAVVALNVVVVVLLLVRPAFRVRFVNWFFKLRSEIRTFAA